MVYQVILTNEKGRIVYDSRKDDYYEPETSPEKAIEYASKQVVNLSGLTFKTIPQPQIQDEEDLIN